jgi:hypothetical protein
LARKVLINLGQEEDVKLDPVSLNWAVSKGCGIDTAEGVACEIRLVGVASLDVACGGTIDEGG